MADTWTQLLAELTAMGKAPRGVTLWTEEEDAQYGSSHGPGWIVDNDGGSFVSDDYDGAAFALIRIAAEDVLREWCRKNDSYIKIDDCDEVLIAAKGYGVIGIGPTIEEALLDALRKIKEEK